MKVLLIFCLMILWSNPVWANKTYEETMAGKSCEEDSRQILSCTYKVGEDLEIWLVGIGLLDTGVTFAKSNFEGDYYATFGMKHLCIIVKSGKDLSQGFAFISPRNGKVYKNWQTCQTTY